MKRAAHLQPHESILIQAAAGGVGIQLVQLAMLMGANHVIGLAGSDEKLELVSQLGADIAVNYTEADWVDRVRTATGGNRVDIVLESVGPITASRAGTGGQRCGASRCYSHR